MVGITHSRRGAFPRVRTGLTERYAQSAPPRNLALVWAQSSERASALQCHSSDQSVLIAVVDNDEMHGGPVVPEPEIPLLSRRENPLM